jgi:16S rRNA (uracil1498-N3)-methyltransferase
MELFYMQEPPEDGRLTLRGPEARHIARVLRHRIGDRVYVTDGRGSEYETELVLVKADRVVGRVKGRQERPREPRHRVTLAQAVLKGDKLTQVCEQAAELGVGEFIPMQTARTIGRLSSTKLERLRAVALSGMKSSTGTVTLEIHPMNLEALVAGLGRFDQALLAYEEERRVGLDEVLRPDVESLLVLIGPEGGFEPHEIQALRQAGAVSFSMGPRRLRAETAGIVALAMVMQLLGDLGWHEHKTTLRGGAIGSW